MPRFVTGHLGLVGFLAGVGTGALAYLAGRRHEAAFVAFATVWYVLQYGVSRVSEHPEHRRAWVAHVALLPVLWIVGVAAIWLTWHHPVWAILFGLAGAAGVQALATQLGLHEVVEDRRHDLLRRHGLE